MTGKPKPLSIAIGAAFLLVVVLAADVSMNRSYAIDLLDEKGTWVPIAATSVRDGREYFGGISPIIDPNGTVEMRVRVDNSYAWPFEKEYVVYFGGGEVARGMLEVPSRSNGTATFTVPGSAFFDGSPPFPASGYMQVELVIAGEHLYGSVSAKNRDDMRIAKEASS